MLPGGGIKRKETPLQAILRELDEELGLNALKTLNHVGTYNSEQDYKKDTIYLFTGISDWNQTFSKTEIDSVILCDPNDLPSSTSPATRRRIKEYLAGIFGGGVW